MKNEKRKRKKRKKKINKERKKNTFMFCAYGPLKFSKSTHSQAAKSLRSPNKGRRIMLLGMISP